MKKLKIVYNKNNRSKIIKWIIIIFFLNNQILNKKNENLKFLNLNIKILFKKKIIYNQIKNLKLYKKIFNKIHVKISIFAKGTK